MRCGFPGRRSARVRTPGGVGRLAPLHVFQECLLEPSVDVTVRGQGEETFAEIVRAPGGRPVSRLSCERLHGAAARRQSFTRIPRAALAQVDKFRAHDYGLIPVERYFDLKGKRQLDYISSQGCNFRCAFCSDPFVYGRKWVGLEPVRMATAIEGVVGSISLR